MTFPEFTLKIKKEEKQAKILNVILFFVYLAIIIGSMVTVIINSNIQEGVIFGVILSLIEIPMYCYFAKLSVKNCAVSIRIIKDCEEKGMDILEYSKEWKER